MGRGHLFQASIKLSSSPSLARFSSVSILSFNSCTSFIFILVLIRLQTFPKPIFNRRGLIGARATNKGAPAWTAVVAVAARGIIAITTFTMKAVIRIIKINLQK